jgi:ADP-ribose pyrophosphatase
MYYKTTFSNLYAYANFWHLGGYYLKTHHNKGTQITIVNGQMELREVVFSPDVEVEVQSNKGLIKQPFYWPTYRSKYVNLYTSNNWQFASRNSVDEVFTNKVNAVKVIAANHEGKIVLVEQFRPPFNANVIEFPAGLVDEFEEPRDAAIREFKEETGLDLEITCDAGSGGSSPGLTDEVQQIFFGHATGELLTKEVKNGSENILLHLLTISELQDMITKGEKNFSLDVKLYAALR